MRVRRLIGGLAACAAVAGIVIAATTASARPNRYGHSDREERHMFPAVSTGPLDPAWSPDGRWIAFSMRGDIWKVPAEGGEAVALTTGPNYHFEPAWSPDGRRIALSMDVAGHLEIGIVAANGGEAPSSASRRTRGSICNRRGHETAGVSTSRVRAAADGASSATT